MAQSEGGQERTEEATPKRREEARKKGQVPRSRELNTAIIVIVGAVSLLLFQGNIASAFNHVTEMSFNMTFDEIFKKDFVSAKILKVEISMINQMWPFFVLLFGSTFIGSILLNGFTVNFSTLAPKLERMDPIKGIQRMFSLKALMELVKALLKFLVIGLFSVMMLWFNFGDLMRLGEEPLRQGMVHAVQIISWSFLIMSCSLLAIASIDVPFQLWEHTKQLKMTKQEIKDEMKETEGHPEVKAQIRRMQQEMTRRRMMAAVPHADVVVTNPTHFAVALKYDETGATAPVVVAKGKGVVAQSIISVAEENHVSLLRIPLLARALFFHTPLDKEIPGELYEAVAHVLAYVYQLKTYQTRGGRRPQPLPELQIPDEMVHRGDM